MGLSPSESVVNPICFSSAYPSSSSASARSSSSLRKLKRTYGLVGKLAQSFCASSGPSVSVWPRFEQSGFSPSWSATTTLTAQYVQDGPHLIARQNAFCPAGPHGPDRLDLKLLERHARNALDFLQDLGPGRA